MKKANHQRGLWKHKANPHDPDVKLADFSYSSTEIADKIIVRAWTNAGFRDGLVADAPNSTVTMDQRITNARNALQALNPPINLTNPIVLTEVEYDQGWEMDNDDQVVFVLPKMSRQANDLLETAKLLMACVPNGI